MRTSADRPGRSFDSGHHPIRRGSPRPIPNISDIATALAAGALADYFDAETETPDRLTLYRAQLVIRGLRQDNRENGDRRQLVKSVCRTFFGVSLQGLAAPDIAAALDEAMKLLTSDKYSEIWRRVP